MKHAVKHLRLPKTAVEPVAEFRQVAGQMFGADAMVDAPDIAFDIGDQGMDPGQDLGRLLPRTGHQPLMAEIGRSVQKAIALPAVGLDHRLGGQAEMPNRRCRMLLLRVTISLTFAPCRVMSKASKAKESPALWPLNAG